MNAETYKRGQVEWALWRATTIGRVVVDAPPAVFGTRIKRLLDLDRTSAAATDPAFSPWGEGQGVQLEYSLFDVFCLGVALDLLDIGFNQGEIVSLVRRLRPDLMAWHPKLVSRPSLIDRQDTRATHQSDLPFIERKGRAALVDPRVFLVLGRDEASDALTSMSRSVAAGRKHSSLLEPIICAGVDHLRDVTLDLMPYRRRVAAVLEITALAQAVDHFLKAAPSISRGRSKRSQPGR